MRRTIEKTVVVLVALSCVTGCAMFQSKKNVGPANVDDLVGWIERVYVDAELAREHVKAAAESAKVLVKADFAQGDAVAGYAEYVNLVERSEGQLEKLKESVGPMKKAAEPVFEQWAKDLESFSSPTMRKRSEARLSATRQRYNAIVGAVDPAMESYEALNKGLRDVALFLGHDFNAVALTDIRPEVDALVRSAGLLDRNLNDTMVAARAYVELAALPIRGLPTADEKAVPVSGTGNAPADS
jgi:hypothetical protein